MFFTIDILRHILALAVILQHMASSRYTAETYQNLLSAVNWIDGAVIGFFFISGFLFKPKDNPLTYIKTQTTRLLLPFLLFSCLYTIALTLLKKTTLLQGLTSTLHLQGAGMQLYFLPLLLLVTATSALLSKAIPPRLHLPIQFAVLPILTFICLSLPTHSSTGPDPKLLPLYWLAFLLGNLHQLTLKFRYHSILIISLITTLLLIGLKDPRFFDLAGFIILFSSLHQLSSFLPYHRLPGSGGIYLLHTPVINFTVSTALQKLGLIETPNIYLSVILTYLFCLASTLFLIRQWPQHKWLLLE
jgi:fucose 4-O-acetylase-like acetyltransferase